MESFLITYWGTALAGKTSNLEALDKLIPKTIASKREFYMDFGTLCFDITIAIERRSIPLKFAICPNFCNLSDMAIQKVKETRRSIISRSRGLVFVVDSQSHKKQENEMEWKNLLKMEGIAHIPIVLQYNKRDMSNKLEIQELSQIFNPNNKYLEYKSVATANAGVIPTLSGILGLIPETSNLSLALLKFYQIGHTTNIDDTTSEVFINKCRFHSASWKDFLPLLMLWCLQTVIFLFCIHFLGFSFLVSLAITMITWFLPLLYAKFFDLCN